MVYFIAYDGILVSFSCTVYSCLAIFHIIGLVEAVHPPGVLDIYNMKKANIDLQTHGFYYGTAHTGQKQPKIKSFGCLYETLT